MATKELRSILLSEETAALFDAKRRLDEVYASVDNVMESIPGGGDPHRGRLFDAYDSMNQVIMDLIARQVDYNSTETRYKVI